MSEDKLITQLKTSYNLPNNLLDLYFQVRDRYAQWRGWTVDHVLADIQALSDTDYYTPLFLVYLFQHSDVATMEKIPKVQFSMTYVPDIVDKDIFATLHTALKREVINLELPYWMMMIKRHAYLTDLFITDQFGDYGWLISDDDEQASIVEDMASSTYLSLEQSTQWGYYIPQELLTCSEISETARLQRHNIMIYSFAKRCAQRKLWDLNTGFLKADPNWVTAPKMGKVAAQSLFQSLIWCRLNYAEKSAQHRPSTLRGMISDDRPEFIPTMYAVHGQYTHMISTYELKTCQRISQWANQIDGEPYPFALLKPYLGDGSLISRVTLEPVGPSSQETVWNAFYSNQYAYHLSFHASSGLVPYWMSSYIRSLARPKSPVVDSIYSGLIDVGPILQNFSFISKNWRTFSHMYVPLDPELYWSTQANYGNALARHQIRYQTPSSYGPVEEHISDQNSAPITDDIKLRIMYPRKRINNLYYPDCFMFSGCPDYPTDYSTQYANSMLVPFDIR
jgi:hypothetical protein